MKEGSDWLYQTGQIDQVNVYAELFRLMKWVKSTQLVRLIQNDQKLNLPDWVKMVKVQTDWLQTTQDWLKSLELWNWSDWWKMVTDGTHIELVRLIKKGKSTKLTWSINEVKNVKFLGLTNEVKSTKLY